MPPHHSTQHRTHQVISQYLTKWAEPASCKPATVQLASMYCNHMMFFKATLTSARERSASVCLVPHRIHWLYSKIERRKKTKRKKTCACVDLFRAFNLDSFAVYGDTLNLAIFYFLLLRRIFGRGNNSSCHHRCWVQFSSYDKLLSYNSERMNCSVCTRLLNLYSISPLLANYVWFLYLLHSFLFVYR